jgi:hypothetical protein
MKILKIIFLSIFLLSINLFSQNLLTRYSQYGEMIVTHLHSASFPDTGRAAGHTYDSTYYSAKDHYMDSTVAVFIPKGFKSGSSINFVIHFHGWFNNVDSTFAQYNLVKQFIGSGKNALLVVPGGAVNVPDSYGGKLEETNGFRRFVKELIDTLYTRKVISNEKVGKIILSGHSGGYRVMSYILMRGGLTKHIKEVYIFDALYAEKEKFIHWFDRYNGKLIDIYTQHGGTKEETEKLMADLKGWKIPFVSFNDEQNVTPFDLANNRLIFIFTDLQHNNVIYKRNEFEEYLKASCLPNIK